MLPLLLLRRQPRLLNNQYQVNGKGRGLICPGLLLSLFLPDSLSKIVTNVIPSMTINIYPIPPKPAIIIITERGMPNEFQ